MIISHGAGGFDQGKIDTIWSYPVAKKFKKYQQNSAADLNCYIETGCT